MMLTGADFTALRLLKILIYIQHITVFLFQTEKLQTVRDWVKVY